MAWDGVRFAGPGENGEGSPAAPPVIDAAGGTVTLPAGSAVEGTLELAPGTRLAWDAVAAEGSARLELAVEGEATPVAGRRVRPGGDGRRELSGRRSVASGASGAGFPRPRWSASHCALPGRTA